MRRYALLGTTVLCAFALATYACGGDDDNASIPNNSSSSSSSGTSGNLSSSSSSSSSSSGTSGTTTSSSSTSSSTSSTSGNTVTPDDAGEVGDGSDIPDSGGSVPDGDTAFDGSAGSKCQVGSQQESEDNGSAATANTIPGKTGTFCGSLSSPSDNDYVKFTLPADAVSLDISTSNTGAGFVLTASINGGAEFPLTGDDAGKFTFTPGATYTLHASSTAASGSTDYIIGVTIAEQPAVSKCTGTSTPEIEPNDSDATATPVTVTGGVASWCGDVSSTSDVDEFKFTMPSGYTHLSTSFSATGAPGALGIAISHGGTAVADPSNIPIVANDVYIFKFTSTSADNAYLYTLTLTP